MVYTAAGLQNDLTKEINPMCKNAWLFPLLLLVGCQQTVNKSPVPVASEQIKQLSALVAGGHYLQQQCKMNDIPDEDILLKTALNSARNRGWDTTVPAYQILAEQSQFRYNAILMDEGRENAAECSRLQLLLVDFLHAARSNWGETLADYGDPV
ncbi:type II secretion system pilot lipoprotein GspS [Enterobacter ludwigii]|jgi:general secretion pathway protein S